MNIIDTTIELKEKSAVNFKMKKVTARLAAPAAGSHGRLTNVDYNSGIN